MVCHGGVETLAVDREAGILGHLLGDLYGQAIGRLEVEDGGARDGGLASLVEQSAYAIELMQAALHGPVEALLFGLDDLGGEFALG